MEKKEFGFTNGYKVFLFTLENKNRMKVVLTNYSGAIVSIFVPDRDGNIDDVVLGYDDLEGYVNGTSSQGALVGRYANRIGGGTFKIDDNEYKLFINENVNTLSTAAWLASTREYGQSTRKEKIALPSATTAPTERKTSPEILR